jgi:hypothetical protein
MKLEETGKYQLERLKTLMEEKKAVIIDFDIDNEFIFIFKFQSIHKIKENDIDKVVRFDGGVKYINGDM